MHADFLEFKQVSSVALALILLLPLAGFLVNGLGWFLFRDKWPRAVVNLVAVAVVAAAFGVSAKAFLDLRAHPDVVYVYTLFEWIKVGAISAPFELAFDRLSAVMCLIVTGVGGVIHLYATGYMAHDQAFARFFAYLNLFIFAMLLLVMGKNIVLMFVGWEGVGLCSYLLIGFWYEDMANAAAGKKAFVVNRVGDFGFLIGTLTILWVTGRIGDAPTLDFYELARMLKEHGAAFAAQSLYGVPVAFIIGLALFVGAVGKSAQLPLYVWLPDAMAGPTPVSALIHAATMVTAGVYMIGRLNFIYLFSPGALMVVAGIGTLTALYAATIALTQNDIKKVLAYSTVSQLGYMFTAMGMAAYAAGFFHLTTHAFFKALLFLGAGSVIHGLAGEQDLRRMGGLKKYLPVTCYAMVAGWIAIAGVFPFAGFVSKDAILWQAFSSQLHPQAFVRATYVLGLVAAICTAIYMTRLMMMTFFTPSRVSPEALPHVHESPWNMWVPLAILAILSVAGGALNWPRALGGTERFSAWLEPMWAKPSLTLLAATEPAGAEAPAAEAVHPAGTPAGTAGTMAPVEPAAPVAPAAASGPRAEDSGEAEPVEWALMALAVALALGAILIVGSLYARGPARIARIARELGPLYRASLNKYWVDELYEATIIEPTKRLSYFLLFRVVDVSLVDGAVNGVGRLAKIMGDVVRRPQTGVAGTYALYITLGLLAIVAYFIGIQP